MSLSLNSSSSLSLSVLYVLNEVHIFERIWAWFYQSQLVFYLSACLSLINCLWAELELELERLEHARAALELDTFECKPNLSKMKLSSLAALRKPAKFEKTPTVTCGDNFMRTTFKTVVSSLVDIADNLRTSSSNQLICYLNFDTRLLKTGNVSMLYHTWWSIVRCEIRVPAITIACPFCILAMSQPYIGIIVWI